MKMLWKLTDNIKYEDCEVRGFLFLNCSNFDFIFLREEKKNQKKKMKVLLREFYFLGM